MKRWNIEEANFIERNDIDEFLEDVIAVCKKHGFSISHEDQQGAFEVEKYSEVNAKWLLDANDATIRER